MPATEDIDRSDDHTGGRRVRRLLVVAGVLLGLLVLYQTFRWGLRAYTSSLIEASVDRPLPRFELRDREGRTYTPAGLRGRTVVLHFFRSHCAGCAAEREEIRGLVAGLDPERVAFLGVMMDRVMGFPEEVTERTLEASGYEHPICMADAAFVDAFHGVGWARITPVVYVADPTGRIVASLRHPYTAGELRAALP